MTALPSPSESYWTACGSPPVEGTDDLPPGSVCAACGGVAVRGMTMARWSGAGSLVLDKLKAPHSPYACRGCVWSCTWAAPPALILVCGSRTLTTHPDARARLERVLVPLLTARPCILTGGATGPDSWALDLARDRGLPWAAFLPSGIRLASRGHDRWSPVPVYPLARNAALVRHAASHHEAGASVLVVGAVDPASRSRGTDHTLRHARAAGLATRRCVLKT